MLTRYRERSLAIKRLRVETVKFTSLVILTKIAIIKIGFQKPLKNLFDKHL